MAHGINKVIILGNTGKDPEIRYMPNGTCVAKFSIATSESWKDKSSGEKKDVTDWHNIVMFGKVAEICEKYVKKGDKLYVEGKIKTRKWKDKDTGQDRYATEIVGETLQLLGSRTSDIASPEAEEEDNSDLPF